MARGVNKLSFVVFEFGLFIERAGNSNRALNEPRKDNVLNESSPYKRAEFLLAVALFCKLVD